MPGQNAVSLLDELCVGRRRRRASSIQAGGAIGGYPLSVIDDDDETAPFEALR